MIYLAITIGIMVFLLLQLTNTPTGVRKDRLSFVFSTAALIFSAVVTAGATVAGVVASKSATKSQRRARDEATRRENIASQRGRARQVREARAARAESQSAAISQGVGGSSAAQGSLGSIQTQLGANLAFNINQGKSKNIQSGFLQDAADATGRANTFGAIATLSTQAGSLFGPGGGLKLEGEF